MIKKNTKAIFEDGEYAGTYDWQGGIPLSEGEHMAIKIDGKTLQYKLMKKEVIYSVESEEQIVNITYSFKESK